MLEVWRQLEPSIAFYNESRTGPMIVPVFVVLGNRQKVPGRLWTCALNGEDGCFLALYPEMSPGLEALLKS